VTGRVVVVGSLNVDVVVQVERHPGSGETVLGSSLRHLPGGKGANQAVAAAEAGAEVALVGCVGDDADGAAYVAGLTARGVDATGVRQVTGPTGTALVVVDEDGENTIVVVPAANALVGHEDVACLALGSGDVVLLQLEIPLPVVGAAIRRAGEAGARVVLNLAPFADLSAELLDSCDPVVVNEHEAAALVHHPTSLLVTLGSRGARWERAGEQIEVGAPKVEAVDTTGAGDMFAGTLAAALAGGAGSADAMAAAVAAAARSVTRPGAQGGWTLS
jgi:ribokinase